MDDASRAQQGDDPLAALAAKHWAGVGVNGVTRLHAEVVAEIWELLRRDDFRHAALQTLEASGLLERYLLPGLDGDSSNQHVLLVAFMLNVKRAEAVPTWDLFDGRADFPALFRRLLALALDAALLPAARTLLLVTVIHAFQSIDSPLIRKECAPLVSISIWSNLHSDAARERLLTQHPQLRRSWRAASKRFDAAEKEAQSKLRFERAWLFTLVLDFVDMLYDTTRQGPATLLYCERFLELLTDLQSQFPTRRFVNTLLQDLNLLVVIKQSPLYNDEDSALLRDFYILLKHFTQFPLDEQLGKQLSTVELAEVHTQKLARLQRLALKMFPEKLKLLALTNYGSLERRQDLLEHLSPLSQEDLATVARELGLRVEYPTNTKVEVGRPFLLELLLSTHERQPGFQEVIQSMSTSPTEKLLYDASFLRNDTYNGTRPLAIPKVNLQYLSVGDFLWRSFILIRCESFYGVQKHMEDVVKRLQPVLEATGATRFTGTSKMACRVYKPAIVDVQPPKVGEDAPAVVKAEVLLDVSRMHGSVLKEWDSLRTDDVVFLLSVQAKDPPRGLVNGGGKADAQPKFRFLRTAEVAQVLDDNGRPLRLAQEQDSSSYYYRKPQQRRLILRLDAKVYQADLEDKEKTKQDVYESINLVVRRPGRENNFKSILDSIGRLAVSDVPLPPWIQDVFLGLGDPTSATYKSLPNALASLDFQDTFLDWQHLRESFPGNAIQSANGEISRPPYVLTKADAAAGAPNPSGVKRRRKDVDGSEPSGPPTADNGEAEVERPSTKGSRKRGIDEVEGDSGPEPLRVSTYRPPNMGPYPTDAPRLNAVRFTPAQVEAIQSGTQPGLTIIVGPPGTGKTDVATQIINNIYHNFPQERTLLVAHSNQALNQLFQKIVALDIDERHLLRLGHGEGELQLESEASYSKHGRVESFLEIGARYLAEVNRLAASIMAPGAHGDTCETADYFNAVYIKPAWKQYLDSIASEETTTETVAISFPFHAFFANAPQPLFPSDSDKEEALEVALGCYRHIEKMFAELEDIRPFEVLRNSRDKQNYLLIKEARIIAMTATHAAIRRREIADLGFRYENVVMEEAAQVTEIENFIPLALQKAQDGVNPLKRVVLCGDHLQNSPITQNLAIRQYANLEQSLFLRLIRLGVPTILLNKQGRARPSLAELYSWRYSDLGNLPLVTTSPEFRVANAGLRHECQFVDVPDYKGKGETEPTPHFVQNLGEAEYAVALFMYMRLLGYPAARISILTMYAGQKALIKDVLAHRCRDNRLFGLPRIVSTVDRYQGEQNDYIILSLVRTSRIGYMRDLRRLTVAFSRARLGLYVLGRRAVFEASAELGGFFERLCRRPAKLELVVGEMFPATRRIDDLDVEAAEMDGVEHLGQYVFEMTRAKVEALATAGGAERAPEREAGTGLDLAEDDVVEGGVPDHEADMEIVDAAPEPRRRSDEMVDRSATTAPPSST